MLHIMEAIKCRRYHTTLNASSGTSTDTICSSDKWTEMKYFTDKRYNHKTLQWAQNNALPTEVPHGHL